MPLFVCGGREIAIFYVRVPKMQFLVCRGIEIPLLCEPLENVMSLIYEGLEKYNSLLFPIFNLNSPYPLSRK